MPPVTRAAAAAASEKYSEPIYEFFTTAEMEQVLNEKHNKEIEEMARRLQGRFLKYTPAVYVGCRATPFFVDGGVVTLRGAPCPSKKQHGGKKYTLIPKFATQVADFHARHNWYQVIFQDTMGLDYEGEGNPAKLHVLDAAGEAVETLVVVDYDEFDIAF